MSATGPNQAPPLVDAAAGVASLRTLGSGATQAMPGNTAVGTGNLNGSLTPGFAPYATGAAALSDSGIYWNNSNGRLGIGTTNPGFSGGITDAPGDLAHFVNTSTHALIMVESRASNSDAGITLYTLASGLDCAIWLDESDSQKLKISTGAINDHTGRTSGTKITLTQAGSLGVNTTGPLSKFDVSGNVAIGSYAGASAAPSNGLIVSGNVGIGTASPGGALGVSGGVGIGSYAATTPPSNGLIVSGPVGVGTSSTGSEALTVVQPTGTGASTASIQNTSITGFSTIVFLNSSGAEKGAVGVANASAPAANVAGKMYVGSPGDVVVTTYDPTTIVTFFNSGKNVNIGTTTTDPGIKLNIEASASSAGIGMGDGSSLAVSASNTARIRYNNSTHIFEQSLNGGAYFALSMSGSLTPGTMPYATGARALADSGVTWSGTSLGVPQIKGSGSAPSFVADTGLGTSPTVSITGTDIAHLISITVGTGSPASNARLLKVSFAVAMSAKPKGWNLLPVNQAAVALAGVSKTIYIDNDDANTTSSGYALSITGSALGTSTGPYEFSVTVIQ